MIGSNTEPHLAHFTLGVPNSDPHKLRPNHPFDVPPEKAIDTINPTLSSYIIKTLVHTRQKKILRD